MANTKITELTAVTALAGTDVFPVVDVSANTTNKVSVEDLLRNAPDGSAGAPSIANAGDQDTGIFFPADNSVGVSTDGTQRLVIDSSGNIGIGTSSPGANLDISSSSNTTTRIDCGTSSASILEFTQQASRKALVRRLNSGELDIINEFGDLRFWTANDGNEVTRLTIDSSGNVGIGTSSPDKLLHLSGADTAVIRLENTDTSLTADQIIGGLEFEKRDGSGAGAGVVGGLRMYSEGSVGESAYLTLSTASSSTNDAERLRIDSSGNVGIGTTSPSAPLAFGKSVYSDQSSEDFYRIKFKDFGGTANDVGIGQPDENSLAFNIQGGSTASCRWLAGTAGERMRLDGNGNVGIGTTSPGAKLHVNSGTANTCATFESTDAGAAINLTDSNARSTIEQNGTTLSIIADTDASDASSDIRLKVDNSTKLIVNSSGQVGIGTTSPGKTLDVDGVIRSDGTSGSFELGANSSTPSVGCAIHRPANNTMAFVTGTNERMRIDNSGRLLVGTSSAPTAGSWAQYSKFTVKGYVGGDAETGILNISRGQAASSISSGSDIGVISFSETAGNEFAWIRCSADAAVGTGDHPGRLTFHTTADGASSPTERMRIDSSGRVGVGLTPTSATLEVSGQNVYTSSANSLATATTKAAFRVKGSTNSSDGLWMGVETSNAEPYIQGANGTGSNAKDILLNPFGGNVGIGTTSPGNTLHLKGAQGVGIRFENSTSTNSSYLTIESGDKYQFNVGGSGYYTWVTGGSEKVRLDSSGRLLVGTTTALDTTAGAITTFHSTSGGRLALGAGTVGAGSSLGEIFGHWNGNKVAGMIAAAGSDTTNRDDGELRFYTSASGPTVTEAMRIDSSGTINTRYAIGETFYAGTATGLRSFTGALTNTGSVAIETTTGSTSNRHHFAFSNPNGVVGSIRTNGSATAYLTSSDYRLKENVVDISDGITRVKQLSPKRFNFIADDTTTVDGFLAHEAQTVVPEAVDGTHNGVDDDNNPLYQGIDQSKLVPLLTAALQEAIAKIETLETKVAALEAQ